MGSYMTRKSYIKSGLDEAADIDTSEPKKKDKAMTTEERGEWKKKREAERAKARKQRKARKKTATAKAKFKLF